MISRLLLKCHDLIGYKSFTQSRAFIQSNYRNSFTYVKIKSGSVNKKVKVWDGMTVEECCNTFKCSRNYLISILNKNSVSFDSDSPNLALQKLSKDHLKSVADEFGMTVKFDNKAKPNVIKQKSIKQSAQQTIDKKDVRRVDYFDKANQMKLQPRQPIVTIMGHVDHGKTTLLDALRNSNVIDQEFGGITQHMGAFKVSLANFDRDVVPNKAESNENDRDFTQEVTFIDTPGHGAFSAMRLRGASCTDIVVMVIAADDGLMPQTKESIRFAHESGVPIIVAVNKLDKFFAEETEIIKLQDEPKKLLSDMDYLWKDLRNCGVDVELWSADASGNSQNNAHFEAQVVLISALKKWNLKGLIEAILIQADLLRNGSTMKPDSCLASYEGMAEAVVLEADTGGPLGPEATVLIRHGRLSNGSVCVAGSSPGSLLKIKDLRDTGRGTKVAEALPGNAVRVTGWKGGVVPQAGDELLQVVSESKAKAVLKRRNYLASQKKSEQDKELYMQQVDAYNVQYREFIKKGIERGIRYRNERPDLGEFLKTYEGIRGNELDSLGRPHLSLVVKADVQGSIDAISNVLNTVIESCSSQIVIKPALLGVGPLTESEISTAVATDAHVYLFNLPPSSTKVPTSSVYHFNVIFALFDHLQVLAQSKLPHNELTDVIGEASVQTIFKIKQKRETLPVAGCLCIKGHLYKGAEYMYRIMRAPDDTNTNNTEESDSDQEYDVVQDNLQLKNLRKHKTEVQEIKGFNSECGMLLVNSYGDNVGDIRAGDIIQCYRIKYDDMKLNWHTGF